ncbi:MAG: ScyD/ScyE family protein [Blastococcus sp.]
MAGGGQDGGGREPVVVAEGLDNPRQLNWGSEDTLLVAEAGSGGDTCVTPPGPDSAPLCAGLTGGITAIEESDDRNATAKRVVDGLFSLAGADGSFAIGSNGADATDVPGEYVVAEGNIPFFPLPPEITGAPGGETLAHLLVVGTDGEQFVLPYTDLNAAEEELNPDGAQIESNPYAVLVVDPTPHGPVAADGYALVADAAANAVWKIEPDFGAVPEDCVDEECIPPFDLTVFAAYPTPPDDEVTPEFVPTSLATDRKGNIYVGGLGSEQPGAAQVVKYTADGEEIRSWDGFTAITGLAVDESGEHVYVSQLFGSDPEAPPTGAPGNVLEVDVESGEQSTVDVPFPAGLAVDDDGNVFVAAYSVAPAEGVAESPETPAFPGGQVWKIRFDGHDD